MKTETLAYAYSAAWSAPTGDFEAKCLEVPNVIGHGPTPVQAIAECMLNVEAQLRNSPGPPPVPRAWDVDG